MNDDLKDTDLLDALLTMQRQMSSEFVDMDDILSQIPHKRTLGSEILLALERCGSIESRPQPPGHSARSLQFKLAGNSLISNTERDREFRDRGNLSDQRISKWFAKNPWKS